MAAMAITNVVKISLGTLGLNKMLFNDVGVWFFEFFTLIILGRYGHEWWRNNSEVWGRTSRRQGFLLIWLNFRMKLVMVNFYLRHIYIYNLGTTSVAIIAAELLKAANELVQQKLHLTTVINGALKKKWKCDQYNQSIYMLCLFFFFVVFFIFSFHCCFICLYK